MRANVSIAPLYRWAPLKWLAQALLLALVVSVPMDAAAARRALVLEIDGPIGPAIAQYVEHGLADARTGDVGVVVLKMNTPGGLDSSMREIIRAILASPSPVVAYVAPSGARAASAGTYIAYACAIAAMAPGTNLGAATPVQLGPHSLFPDEQPRQPRRDGKPDEQAAKGRSSTSEPADAETRKIVNDAVAYLRSLAQLNGRNADWAAASVLDASSLPANEALEKHVIDLVADDLPDLLRKADGRTVRVAGKPMTIATSGLEIVTVAPDWRTQLLAVIASPDIAFLLFLLGVYGLIFEFLNPGAIAPGLIGAISLLVAFFALGLLPIDYAGMALVLLGVGLMIAEVFIGSFGVIGLGGVVSFAIGSIIMFRAEAPGFALSRSVVVAATLASVGFCLVVLSLLLRSRRRPVVTGKEALLGAEAETADWQDGEGRVRLNGEIWLARAAKPIEAGMRVRVVDRDGLVLIVEPA